MFLSPEPTLGGGHRAEEHFLKKNADISMNSDLLDYKTLDNVAHTNQTQEGMMNDTLLS